MENIELKKSSCSVKKVKRGSCKRKAPQDRCIINNIAEAGEEIVTDDLHANTLNSNNRSLTSSTPQLFDDTNFACAQNCYYCPLLESLPFPEPTWSTTAPSVLATPPPPPPSPPPPPMEAMEFEWPDYYTSTYTWWLGFLKSLDGTNNASSIAENLMTGGSSRAFVQFHSGESLSLGLGVKEESSCPEDWLTVLTNEDDGQIPN